jgi:hypothetical protein
MLTEEREGGRSKLLGDADGRDREGSKLLGDRLRKGGRC